MSIDFPDDPEIDAWLRDLPDEDGEIDMNPVLPPALQAEHDRLLAELGQTIVRLDPDLEELETKIANADLRRMFNADFPPYMFGRFEAIDTVRGGMGLVIKARDPQLDRTVAIKLWMRSGPEAQDHLIAEAKTLAKFKHPNVVMVYETGIWNDRVYFVMEWIEGVDGHDWMRRQRSWREVRRVFVAAGTGLAAANDAGIHHRDFKPSNVLIGKDGRVVVADFGLAASLPSSRERDESGGGTGTPVYMAPERLRGKRGDARSDQFSFCAAMWRALFGQRPFAGETGGELSAAIEAREFRETPGADVPRWLVEAVRKGLAYDPDARHRDMHAVIAALIDEPAVAGDDDVSTVDGRVLHKGAVPAAPQRERWPYVTIGFLAALVGVLGFGMLTRSPTPEPPFAAATPTFEPYHVVLGLIAADEFREAQRHWLAHRSELTDRDSLKIAGTLLERARQLALVDPMKASEATVAGFDIANEVQRSGRTVEAREAGGRLASEVEVLNASRPPE